MKAEPQSKRVDANGLNIHYWDWAGDGPAMVMLHPSGGSGRNWDFLARYLHPEYRLICPDQRGHGDSDKPDADYAGEDYAADLDAFTRELGLGKFILVGHSLGSRAGIIFTAQHPDRVSHLILIGGPHYGSMVPSVVEDKERFNNAAREQETRPLRFRSTEEVIQNLKEPTSFYRTISDEALRHLVTYNVNHNPDGSVEWKYDRKKVAETLRHAPDDLTSYAKRITCPVLIPWTKREEGLTPEKVSQIKPLFPTAQWVLMEGVQYFIYFDAPQKLAKLIREFLV